MEALTALCILSLVAGAFCSILFGEGAAFLSSFTQPALCFLVFMVGVSLWEERETLREVRAVGLRWLALPAAVVIGSVLGGMAAGMLVGMSPGLSAAVAGGMGWYSLSAPIVGLAAGTQGAALALTANLFRELLAFTVTPHVAKRVGKVAAIAPAGSTSMDTALPLIASCTDAPTAALSVATGLFLSLTVAPLVSALCLLI